jgi:hypothetical protein
MQSWGTVVSRIQLLAEISLSDERKLYTFEKNQQRRLVISVWGMSADVVFNYVNCLIT